MERLQDLSDEALQEECEGYIWLIAMANSRLGNTLHLMLDGVYDECKRRGNIDIYRSAYEEIEQRIAGAWK